MNTARQALLAEIRFNGSSRNVSTPSIVGDYRLTGKIGNGACATCYKATHIYAPNCHVVIKAMHKTERHHAGFLAHERELMFSLLHRNIVRLFQVIDTENFEFLIMEYADGGDLTHILEKSDYIPEATARSYTRQVVRALQFAHFSGIVHRDVKLENIFLTRSGEIKLGDWGLAKRFRHGSTEYTRCGSAHYVAPEILLHRPHHPTACDVWSLGVSLYGMVTGFLPFCGAGSVLSDNIVHNKYSFPSSGPSVSLTCRHLIERMLDPDPNTRISMKEIARHPWISAGELAPRARKPVARPRPALVRRASGCRLESLALPPHVQEKLQRLFKNSAGAHAHKRKTKRGSFIGA